MSRIGVVLAGGRGRRLGRSKGQLVLDGVSLAERAAAALGPLCDEVLVSLARATGNPVPRCRAVRDGDPPGRGPLAGLAAAWRAAGPEGGADLLVLACDYPRVDTSVLEPLVEGASISSDAEEDVVLWCDSTGRRHPLVALWRASSRGPVTELVSSGRDPRVGAVLERLRVRELGPADLLGRDLDPLLVNVNTPADLRRLGGSSGGVR